MRLFIWIGRWTLLFLPWAACLIIVGWLLIQHFPLDGVVHMRFAMDGNSPWLDPFLPAERVSSPGLQPDGWIGQRIFMDPVYASLRVPGVFDRVRLEFDMHASEQPLVDIGMLRDEATFGFESKPLWSRLLQTGWRQVHLGDRQGYVRETLPDSALLTQDSSKILLWHATHTSAELMDIQEVPQAIPVSLRGSHDFWIVPVQGRIMFRFLIQDMNRTREAGKGNSAVFRVTRGDELIASEAIGLGGWFDNRSNQVVEKTVTLDHLSPGVYRLAFLADDDVFIRSIETRARHWVIGPRLYLGDTTGFTGSEITSVITNSYHVVAQTFHASAKQRIVFGKNSIDVYRTHTPFAFDKAKDDGSVPIWLQTPKADMRYIGDGFFAFDPAQLFLPMPRRFTDASDPLTEGIDAILTSYERPTVLNDGWVRVRVEFALPIPHEREKISFTAPGLFARGGAIDVRDVGIEYQRSPFTFAEMGDILFREMHAAWKRIWL